MSKELFRLSESYSFDTMAARYLGADFDIHAGISGGHVLLFEGDDYIGRPVNLAARLCDEADPHQVLVTASLFDASGDGLEHRRLGPRAIRGFTRQVEVVDMSEGGLHTSALARRPDAYEHTNPSGVGNRTRMVVSGTRSRPTTSTPATVSSTDPRTAAEV